MIAQDSPFRTLPAELPPRQILYFDALRLSAEMVQAAYEQLEAVLHRAMEMDTVKLGSDSIGALLYAYAVVDAGNRFRDVFRVAPRLKHNEVYNLFMRSTENLEQLRDVVQHLNNELSQIGESRASALGTITWLGPSPATDAPPSCWTLQPGTSYPEQRTLGPLVDRLSYLPAGAVDQIVLRTSRVKVDLGEISRRVSSVIQSLEVPLREYAEGKPRLGSNRLVSFELTPVPSSDEPERDNSPEGD